MEPSLAINDKQMFYNYLDSSKIYFEYGVALNEKSCKAGATWIM